MHAPAESVTSVSPRKRWFSVTPAIEFAVLAAVLGVAGITYWIVRGFAEKPAGQPPEALLLLANLIPCVVLIVLIGRRIAKHRAARSQVAGGGRLHVRLVATFSVLASVPIILTVIAASLMFQAGIEFWVSNRAQHAFKATIGLVDEGQKQIIQRWLGEARQLADDVARDFKVVPEKSQEFQVYFNQETYYRNLEQSILFNAFPDGRIQVLYVFNPPTEAEFAQRITPKLLEIARRDASPFIDRTPETIWVLRKIPNQKNMFVYVGTSVNAAFVNQQHQAADAVLDEYGGLTQRVRATRLTFNIILFAVALFIVAVTVWIALKVADRLVRPIDQLVSAARQVTGGDLGTRVPPSMVEDEIGTLGNAFNIMTGQLQEQTNALVTANAQLESRRALIEAVMSGVTAGVISTDSEGRVRLINASARALLRHGDADPAGRPLAEIAPELGALLGGVETEAVVQLATAGEARTLAVKITGDEAGQVLTFDDITQQLLDQRRAAWSDVARRIAHEIKNPLTPIQLAAERLQRRYGKQVDGGAEDSVFQRLTGTIVRQVGDLRRIVDEFSSFARMPKPMFRSESLLDIARQAMFLHEVAHPALRFELDVPENAPALVCDRRQIGQALTNIVKNAVEAIEARGEGEALPQGEIVLTIEPEGERRIVLSVADNGIGLPVERDRIVEPYMTTRSRGTGLGLAIVKKIIEEHFGAIAFTDREGGGTVVTLCFDTEMLGELAGAGDTEPTESDEPRPAALTRTGSTKS
jgi:two-component system nitrogen regulation sensor histidine kinase NtrY